MNNAFERNRRWVPLTAGSETVASLFLHKLTFFFYLTSDSMATVARFMTFIKKTSQVLNYNSAYKEFFFPHITFFPKFRTFVENKAL